MEEIRRVQTPAELEQARALRHEIFVREQEIPIELEEDGLDEEAEHVLVLIDGEPVATGRLVITDEGDGVLARIAVRSGFRGRSLGKRVVRELERYAEERRVRSLSLHPHRYLERFYRHLGYATVPGTDVVGKHELIKMTKRLAADR